MISGEYPKNKKIRILLISANQCKIPYPVYPLGLSYIFSFLKRKLPEAEISIFDMILNTGDELIRFIKKFQPHFTGVSLRNIDDVDSFTQHGFIDEYRNLINIIKENSNSIIITGGSGFSIFPEKLFEILQPDYGIFGEGELSFYKLIRALTNNQDPTSIERLVYEKDGQILKNPASDYTPCTSPDFNLKLLDYYWHHSGMLNIQTKRGCPFKCSYCTYPLIEGSKVRTLDADKIIDTLSELYFDNKIDYVFFTDSVFNLNKNFNYELAEKIIRNKIKIKWGAYFTISNFDEELLKILKTAGLTHIEFGTEAFSDITLQSYGKHFSVAEIIEKSALCNKTGINFAHFLILGGLGETKKSLTETFENSKKINNSVFFPFVGMRIYPGTKLHKDAIQEGVIEKDDPLLEPKFYISKDIEIYNLKERAKQTGKRWVFPNEDLSLVMTKMRKKNKKGPLWEYLIR